MTLRTAVIDPSSTGTGEFIKTRLNGDYSFVAPSWARKLLGVCPLVVINNETTRETICVRIDIESPDVPFRESFLTKPIEPKGYRKHVELQDFHEMNWILRKSGYTQLDFCGTNPIPYTSAPHVGFQLIFEDGVT